MTTTSTETHVTATALGDAAPRCQWVSFAGDDPHPRTCDRPSAWAVFYDCAHITVVMRYCDPHAAQTAAENETDGIEGTPCGCPMAVVMERQ